MCFLMVQVKINEQIYSRELKMQTKIVLPQKLKEILFLSSGSTVLARNKETRQGIKI